jgi:hypothetical protein
LTDEFFIHKVENQSSVRDGGGAATDEKSTQLNVTSTTAFSTREPSSMNLVSTILAMNPEKNEDDSMAEDWNSLFTLRLSMLPTSYIPATLG